MATITYYTDAQTAAETALNYRLQTQGPQDMHIVFPNQEYTPQADTVFLQVFHSPREKVQATLGREGWNRVRGTMVIYIHYPTASSMNAGGTYGVYQIAAQLVALYDRQIVEYEGTYVHCTRSQRVSDIPTDTRYITIVEVDWYSNAEVDRAITVVIDDDDD